VEIPAIAEMIEGTLDRMRKSSEQSAVGSRQFFFAAWQSR
jgi:hypothetical protein